MLLELRHCLALYFILTVSEETIVWTLREMIHQRNRSIKETLIFIYLFIFQTMRDLIAHAGRLRDTYDPLRCKEALDVKQM
jgi:hypothetical protein